MKWLLSVALVLLLASLVVFASPSSLVEEQDEIAVKQLTSLLDSNDDSESFLEELLTNPPANGQPSQSTHAQGSTQPSPQPAGGQPHGKTVIMDLPPGVVGLGGGAMNPPPLPEAPNPFGNLVAFAEVEDETCRGCQYIEPSSPKDSPRFVEDSTSASASTKEGVHPAVFAAHMKHTHQPGYWAPQWRVPSGQLYPNFYQGYLHPHADMTRYAEPSYVNQNPMLYPYLPWGYKAHPKYYPSALNVPPGPLESHPYFGFPAWAPWGNPYYQSAGFAPPAIPALPHSPILQLPSVNDILTGAADAAVMGAEAGALPDQNSSASGSGEAPASASASA